MINFVLEQIVSGIKWAFNWTRRAKLSIEAIGDGNRILVHLTELDSRQWVEEIYYAFGVRNRGKQVAHGARFQLIRIETRDHDEQSFRTVSDTVLNLHTYSGAGKRGSHEATIVPNASVTVGLAWWREDVGVVMPLAVGIPDYYEEGCMGTAEYQFTVVVFLDKESSDSVERTFVLRPGKSG